MGIRRDVEYKLQVCNKAKQKENHIIILYYRGKQTTKHRRSGFLVYDQ